MISGTVIEAHPTRIVVDVGGIGYLVHTTAKIGCTEGETISLHTHLAVRENALDLYGFVSQEELACFELLLTLPKIGPKSAMQILSQADVSLIQGAVLSQDPTHLSKLSGISKKTAEKIVAGLKDAFDDAFLADPQKPHMHAGATALIGDTLDALTTLGYPHAESRAALSQLLKERPDIQNVNDAIKEMLKVLS